ncbi:DUF262 domain-containing protein [Chloroflexota bacterium]
MALQTEQKTESIEQLIKTIDTGDVTLPEFQRDFVWEEVKTHDLFDSIIKDIFIGSLIYGIPSFEITVRKLDDRPRKGVGSRKKLEHQTLTKADINKRVQTGQFRLLLDGQQRVTCIYRALNNIDEVWIIINNDNELPPAVKDKPSIDRTLEEVLYEVTGKQYTDRLSIRLSDVYKMLKGDIVREKDKEVLLANTSYYQSQDFNIVDKNEVFEKYIILTNELINILRAEKLLSYYLLDTNEEKFALFLSAVIARASS